MSHACESHRLHTCLVPMVGIFFLVASSAQAACPPLPNVAKVDGFLEMKPPPNGKNALTTQGERTNRAKAEGAVAYSDALGTLIYCDGTGWLAIDKTTANN